MSLRVKIPALVALLIALAVAAGLFGIHRLHVAVQETRTLLQRDAAAALAVHAVQSQFKTQVQEWKNVLLRGRDPQLLDKHWTAFVAREADVARGMQQLQQALDAGPARESVQQFVAAHGEMAQAYRQALASFRAAGMDPQAGDAAVRGKDRAPSRLLDEAVQRITAHSAALATEVQAQASAALGWSLAAMLVACVLAGAGAWWLVRSICQRVDQAAAVAAAVAAGDLSQAIPSQGQDELGRLLGSLHAMRSELAQVVGTVRGSSRNLADSSRQMAGANAELSDRTGAQASALEQTTASMGQLAETAQRNAEQAGSANALAAGASQAVQQGGQVVQQVVATMRQIDGASRRMADIIGTIDGIAFQTNILALNAAVEAARAGEQGRGFAVVASEVRSLAQRSGEAARETRSLIQSSVEQVAEGTRLADQAGTAIEGVVGTIDAMARLVQSISQASQDQNGAVHQVGAAVSQLDQVTQQNAALVARGASEAALLREQSQQLVSVVDRFRLPA